MENLTSAETLPPETVSIYSLSIRFISEGRSSEYSNFSETSKSDEMLLSQNTQEALSIVSSEVETVMSHVCLPIAPAISESL